MSQRERELAVERISLPDTDPLVMPPRDSRQLTDDVRTRLIAYLREEARPPEDDALLEQVAEYGMMGGARR